MKGLKRTNSWFFSALLAVLIVGGFLAGLTFLPKHTLLPTSENPLLPGPAASGTTQVQHVSGLLAYKSEDDLIHESEVILSCNLVEISTPFQIQGVGGGVTNYTDYYFKPVQVYRGEEFVEDIVTVRAMGGLVGDLDVVLDDVELFNFQVGNNYLLYLHAPGQGGGYNTRGDYYYVTGGSQGVYHENEAGTKAAGQTTFSDTTDQTYIKSADFSRKVSAVNETDPPIKGKAREQFLENQKGNLETGFYTQEVYDKMIRDSEQYATIISEPPRYSGAK